MAAITDTNSFSPSTGTVYPAFFAYPVAASTVIVQHSFVCLDLFGNAVPMSNATGLFFVGQARNGVDNSGGAAAALTVNVDYLGGPTQNFVAVSPVGYNTTNSWLGKFVYPSGISSVALAASGTFGCVGSVVAVVNSGATTGSVTVDVTRKSTLATS